MRRRGPVFALLLATALGAATAAHTQTQSGDEAPADTAAGPKVTLTVATWGGAYEQSQRKAYFDPFAKETGHTVEVVTRKDDRAEVTDKLAADPSPWDVVDLAADAAAKACADGLLERIDPTILTASPAGAAATEDYLPGGLQDCAVASVAWSAAIVYNRRAFEKQSPVTLKDVFDAERFSGKRALPKGPKYTLELALLADGVAPAEVYTTLESDAGVDRAFAALDRIKDSIVWWEQGREPLKLLADGGATIALAFNGRIFSAIVRDHQPLEIIWDGQIYDIDMWAIPKAAEDKDAAREFIAFATAPQRLAAQTKWFPYGPMRKSAVDLVGKHAEIDVSMAGFLPTGADNMKTALRLDGAWWAEHEDALAKRFETWLTSPKKAPEQPPEDAPKDAEEPVTDPQ